ncbi:MAG: TonB-dependent receptor [Saprospiraceae bacterium]|nr:TonB-dependent receptor [Saprospiraceae bacterium]
MRTYVTLCLLFSTLLGFSQTASVKGQLQGPDKEALAYVNVALMNAADSSLAKAGISDESGVFEFRALKAGNYFFKAVTLNMQDLTKPGLTLTDGQLLDLGVVGMTAKTLEIAEATITATRPLVEVRPDRTVFNVQGTINSTGADALALLRKAPSVTVDNNDNINVLGRAGVLLYVDGKRLPLSGQDLSSYLQSLPADQIDRIDIITNPGAKYEAEGNAGIIDIRLKKDKNLGANGSVSTTASQGKYGQANLSGTGNFRNKKINLFGSGMFGVGKRFDNMKFYSLQNDIIQDEINENLSDARNGNYRLGLDFFKSKTQTFGFLVGGNIHQSDRTNFNRIELSPQSNPEAIDSILVANNTVDVGRRQQTYNLNYRFDDGKGKVFNVDVDYGNYRNTTLRYQPNLYYDATESNIVTEVIKQYDTPSDIDIYTAQFDFENKLLGGLFGAGAKFSRVVSDNTFLAFDQTNGVYVMNDSVSNLFDYDEMVYAGYVNYQRELSKKWNLSAGLRVEQTDATGNLTAFLPELQEPPVELNYLNWFPNLGLTYQISQQNSLSFNAGRRINRPDYNVLNPFNNRLSELSYEKGNPFLKPEIVNNVELGYTLAYRYNFKLGYSHTTNQITRLIAPDTIDPRAGYITWDNLASQTIFSFNVSAPVQITKKWNAYFNLNASHIDNQADYGNGAVVDVQAFTYNIYQQHTIDLPFGFKGEISGWYSGPGVWGGVFLYESSWSLDLGLQKKFLHDKLNVRLSASDIFYESGWDGYSDFNGLYSTGGGRWDSRRVSLSLNYRFGNDNVKTRRRETSIEAEQKRVGG